MDVKSGATVGFIAAMGVAGGAFVGLLIGGGNTKQSGHIATFTALAGGLTGAFIGGALVAPSTSSTAALPAPTVAATTAPATTATG